MFGRYFAPTYFPRQYFPGSAPVAHVITSLVRSTATAEALTVASLVAATLARSPLGNAPARPTIAGRGLGLQGLDGRALTCAGWHAGAVGRSGLDGGRLVRSTVAASGLTASVATVVAPSEVDDAGLNVDAVQDGGLAVRDLEQV